MRVWIKAHLAELIGSVAALGLLILVFLNSKKSSGTVAPASLGAPTTPAAPTGPNASDIQSAITTALQGYVTTGQEQADLASLGTGQQGLLDTAIAQLKQAEQQDTTTIGNNLGTLTQQFQKMSQDYAAFAAKTTGTQQDQANQLAQQSKDIAAAMAAAQNNPTQGQLDTINTKIYGIQRFIVTTTPGPAQIGTQAYRPGNYPGAV